MKQFITRPQHGFTDYPYVAAVSAAPTLVGFKGEKTAVALCKVMSATILGQSIFTRAEWGFIRVLPYRAHLLIDFLGGVFCLGAPWLFGFSRNERARDTFLAMGVVGVLAGTLSKPEEMD